MNHSPLKSALRTFLTLSLFLGVSSITIWQAFAPLSVSSLRTKDGVIEENGKGLYIHTGDIRQPIFKVSPFDDYVYHSDGTKAHIFENFYFNDTGTVHTLADSIQYYFHQLTLPTNTFPWTITGPQGTVHYTASINNKTVTITRAILTDGPPISAYGNAVVVCRDCFISSGQTVYLTGVYATNTKLLESLSSDFTPVLVAEELPSDVKTIDVRSVTGEKILRETGSSLIRYEEPWHLLEMKSNSPIQTITLSR